MVRQSPYQSQRTLPPTGTGATPPRPRRRKATQSQSTTGPGRRRKRDDKPEAPEAPAPGIDKDPTDDELFAGLPPWMSENPLEQAKSEADLMTQMAEKQAERDAARISGVYGALGNQLGALNAPYQQQSAQIAQDLQGQIGGLTGLIGTATPAAEQDAAGALMGTLGAGGMELLANDRQRGLDYNTSAQRQGVIESEVTARRYLEDLKTYLADLRSGIPGRADEKRALVFEQMMALKEYLLRRRQEQRAGKSEDAFNTFLQGQIEGSLGGGGKAGGGGGLGGGGSTGSVAGSTASTGGGGKKNRGPNPATPPATTPSSTDRPPFPRGQQILDSKLARDKEMTRTLRPYQRQYGQLAEQIRALSPTDPRRAALMSQALNLWKKMNHIRKQYGLDKRPRGELIAGTENPGSIGPGPGPGILGW
jgi:hypothetical protein